MKAAAVFEFVNDWRDTIFYSVVLIGCPLAYFIMLRHGIAQDLKHYIFDCSQFIFWRELFRSCAWDSSANKKICNFVVSNILIVKTTISIFFGIKYAWWFQILFGILFIITYYEYKQTGGYKIAFKTWWKNMFDWPRKQKPPKHRWDAVKRKIEDALEKFRPSFIPSPAGCAILLCLIAAPAWAEEKLSNVDSWVLAKSYFHDDLADCTKGELPPATSTDIFRTGNICIGRNACWNMLKERCNVIIGDGAMTAGRDFFFNIGNHICGDIRTGKRLRCPKPKGK